MNQKLVPLVNSGKGAPREQLHRIEDIMFSDADTFPEFSNRDGSKERTDGSWQLMMVRVAEQVSEAQTRAMSEAVLNEMRATWKTPPNSFSFFCASHLSILNLAHGIAKKSIGEKTALRASYCFCEPKNDKFPIAKESEVKSLKYEVILGASRFNWDKEESAGDIAKRVESTLFEVMRVIPNVVLFVGPLVFDILYETLEKQKRKTLPKSTGSVVIENFRRKNDEWKRVQKSCVTLLAAPFKPVV